MSPARRVKRVASLGGWMLSVGGWMFLFPVAAADAPKLTAIFPSGDLLPANHLKFYLHFSEPMQEGVFLAHCRLLDESDEPVQEPFRETELWSDDRRRLTLWLHPGRQKTGVNLNEEFGPVLEPGRRYALVISGEWPSDRGVVLGAEVQKSFRAGPRITRQLDPAEWQIVSPLAGTCHQLVVRFPAPLDHALLGHCLRVQDAKGAAVIGTSGDLEERVWSFSPQDPWLAGGYFLAADSVLEDLAGNSLARPFEVDLEAPPPRAVRSVVTVPFVISAETRR